MRLIAVLLLFSSLCSAQKVDLLVQGAVDSELQPLLTALRNKKEIHIAAWTFWTGQIGTKSIVVSRTEVGPINAAAATALGIEKFHPTAVVNQGMAGAHNPRLMLWDIVVGEWTTDYGAFQSAHRDKGAGIDAAQWVPLAHKLRLDNRKLTEFRRFAGDAKLMASALSVPYTRGKVVKGNIGSAYQYNRELDHIERLHRVYGTDSEDMESAFSAGVAAGMKTSFLAIRIISSEWTHPTLERIAGEYCAKFVLDFVRALP